MRNAFRSIILITWLIGFFNLITSKESRAQAPAPQAKRSPEFGGEIKKDNTEFLNFNFKEGRNSDTLNYIDKQNKAVESGDRSQKSLQEQLTGNRAKAEEMANLIKDEELQKAFARVTVKGKQLLQENQELKNPLAVLAGAATLWYGRTIKLIRSEAFNLSTRVDGRGRSGEFSMESPLFNGKLHYQGGTGIDISMNRSISSIDTQAELNYNMTNQSFNTQLRHKLSPNVDFTFGASQSPATPQTDGRATFQYRLDF